MPDTFPTSEYRLVQTRGFTSAADALAVTMNVSVPAGKIWTVISMAYMPSVAETRSVSFQKLTAVAELALQNPVSMLLNPARATGLTEGAFIDLLPGEYLQARRDVATAGSTMALTIQFIEWDLPLYDYIEPQIAARVKRTGTSLAARVFRGGGPGSRPGTVGSGARGGRTPLPK